MLELALPGQGSNTSGTPHEEDQAGDREIQSVIQRREDPGTGEKPQTRSLRAARSAAVEHSRDHSGKRGDAADRGKEVPVVQQQYHAQSHPRTA